MIIFCDFIDLLTYIINKHLRRNHPHPAPLTEQIHNDSPAAIDFCCDNAFIAVLFNHLRSWQTVKYSLHRRTGKFKGYLHHLARKHKLIFLTQFSFLKIVVLVKLNFLTVFGNAFYPVNAEIFCNVVFRFHIISHEIEIIFAEHYRRRYQPAYHLAPVHFDIADGYAAFVFYTLYKPPEIRDNAFAIRSPRMIMIHLFAYDVFKTLSVFRCGKLFKLAEYCQKLLFVINLAIK